MPARNRMVHRAQVLRRGERDPFDTFGPDTPDQHIYGGDPLPLTWGDLTLMWGSLTLDWGSAASTLLPCYVQPRVERKVSDSGRFFSVVTYRMLAPKDANLRDEDRITEVTNRRGIALFEDTLRVVGQPVNRETHLEATLEAYG